MSKFGRDGLYREFANSPASLSYLEANFGDADAEFCSAFLDSVDESAFSLREWVNALMVLAQWLDSHSAELSLEDQIGYVSCAAEIASGSATWIDLPELVEEMLADHGCERAFKK